MLLSKATYESRTAFTLQFIQSPVNETLINYRNKVEQEQEYGYESYGVRDVRKGGFI